MKLQTKQEQIENWLRIGFTQPIGKISEVFYYDKRDNQFFSILVSDYFNFDENYKIPNNITSSYPKNILLILADRMQRIENNDKSIIILPRFGKLTENNDSKNLSEKIDSFIKINAISIDNSSIWEIDQTGSVSIDLRNEKRKKVWWKFWKYSYNS